MSGDLSEELHALIRDIGDAGMVKMASAPWLVAAIDQHVAAIRDTLLDSGEVLDLGALLDYLHGFAHSAFERGWRPSQEYDWEFIRVVAVCCMMRGLPPRGAVSPA